MNSYRPGKRKKALKSAAGVFFGFLLGLILLNIPGIPILYVMLVVAIISLLIASFVRWAAKFLDQDKRKRIAKDSTIFGLVCLAIALISWISPMETPISLPLSIGLLIGSLLGVALVYLINLQ